MNLEETVQSDDSPTFIETIMLDMSLYSNYSLKGSKKHCIFCKCAYLGSDSCIEASLAADMMCNHLNKNASYYAAAGNKVHTLILLKNDNAKFENAVLGAVKYGKYQAFMWLLQNNYDITTNDLKTNESIFLKCARGGDPKIFEYLIQNFRNHFTFTETKNKKVKDDKNYEDVLRISTKYNNRDIVDLILMQPEYQIIHDVLPIINSIQNQNTEMTQKLINAAQIPDSAKYKLFNVALDSHNIDIISFLSEKYKISLKGVIFKAVESNSIDFVKGLLEKGVADINEKNEYGVHLLI